MTSPIAMPGSRSPKRPRRPTATESWYPYYAGYGEAFVDAGLGTLDLPADARVLDPWNGSGTTTTVAYRRGYQAIGVDINPIATIVASAKVASCVDVKHMHGLADEIVLQANRTAALLERNDPLLDWLTPAPAGFVRSAQRQIIHLLATHPTGIAIQSHTEVLPPIAAFFTMCLLRAVRHVANPITGSNPTWQRAQRQRVAASAIASEFKRRALQYSEHLTQIAQDSRVHTAKDFAPVIVIGNARSMPHCADQSVDAVITSPPYCTRIDYVVSTGLELAILGLGRNDHRFADLRRLTTGTPLVRTREISAPPKEWGPLAQTVLASIREHHSQDSASYYYKNYWQYFSDIFDALRELHRIFKPGGHGLFVLQTSFYKDIEIDLPGIFIDMAHQTGFFGGVAASHPVKQVISTMNSRSQKHAPNRKYREDVVALKQPEVTR